MPQQEWYRVADACKPLGFQDSEGLRRWIRLGIKAGWLKVGRHIKPANPKAKRVTWLVHFQRCNEVGVKT